MAYAISGKVTQSGKTRTPNVIPKFNSTNNTILLAGLNGPASDFHSISTDGAGTFMAVGSSGFVARSTDNGYTWDETLTGPHVSGALRSIEYGANGTWMLANNVLPSTRAKTTDNGVSWVGAGSGLGNILATNGTGTWFGVHNASNNTGASRSTDESTWATVSAGFVFGHDVELVDTDTLVRVHSSGWALRSTNTGSSWSNLTRGLNSGSTTTSFYAVKSANGTVIAVGTGGRSSRSTDYGQNWSGLPVNLDSGITNHMRGLATDGNGVWVVAARFNEAAYSLDDGQTWTAFTFSSSSDICYDISYSNNSFVAIGQNGYAVRNDYN